MTFLALVASSLLQPQSGPDTTGHSHITTSERLTARQAAQFINRFSDSTRVYSAGYDLTDAKSLSAPGIRYAVYGPGQPSAFFIHGLRPADQSLVINGMELTSPVTHQLHPSFLTFSSLSLLSPDGVSGGTAPVLLQTETSPAPYGIPVATISYQQGFDNLQLFEGSFSARFSETTAGRFTFGRKTFDGPFEGSSGTTGILPGFSDQYQVTAAVRQTLSDHQSLGYFLSSDRLESGNPGGIDDSLAAIGQSSRSNPIAVRFMSQDATATHRLFLAQIFWDFSDTLGGLVAGHRLLTGYQTGYSRTNRPADDWNSTASRFSSRYETLTATSRSSVTLDPVTVLFSGGIRSDLLKESSYLFSNTRYLHVPVSAGIETAWQGIFLQTEYRREFNDRQEDASRFGISGSFRLDGYRLSSSFSRTIRPVSWLDARLLNLGKSYSGTDRIRLITADITREDDQFTWNAGVAFTRFRSDGAGYSLGRVLPDSVSWIGLSPDFSSTSLHIQFIHQLGSLETEGRYLFTDSGILPAHHLKLGLFWSGLYFTDHLYLKAGLEGTLQTSGKAIYPDIRYQTLLTDPEESSGAIKKVDLTVRARVSDILFHLIWENITNEPYELYQGYPMPISRVHLGLTWWIWN